VGRCNDLEASVAQDVRLLWALSRAAVLVLVTLWIVLLATRGTREAPSNIYGG